MTKEAIELLEKEAQTPGDGRLEAEMVLSEWKKSKQQDDTPPIQNLAEALKIFQKAAIKIAQVKDDVDTDTEVLHKHFTIEKKQ